MKRRRRFYDPNVKALFDAYPNTLRPDLLALRELIFDTASKIEGVGPLSETLKWRQPAYLPVAPKTGSTIRIDVLREPGLRYAMFFHCQTTLVTSFRELYPDIFVFKGNRSVVFSHGDSLPHDALKNCIA